MSSKSNINNATLTVEQQKVRIRTLKAMITKRTKKNEDITDLQAELNELLGETPVETPVEEPIPESKSFVIESDDDMPDIEESLETQYDPEEFVQFITGFNKQIDSIDSEDCKKMYDTRELVHHYLSIAYESQKPELTKLYEKIDNMVKEYEQHEMDECAKILANDDYLSDDSAITMTNDDVIAEVKAYQLPKYDDVPALNDTMTEQEKNDIYKVCNEISMHLLSLEVIGTSMKGICNYAQPQIDYLNAQRDRIMGSQTYELTEDDIKALTIMKSQRIFGDKEGDDIFEGVETTKVDTQVPSPFKTAKSLFDGKTRWDENAPKWDDNMKTLIDFIFIKYDVRYIAMYDIGLEIMPKVMELYYPNEPIVCVHINPDASRMHFMRFHKTHWVEVKHSVDVYKRLIKHVIPALEAIQWNLDVQYTLVNKWLLFASKVKESRERITKAFAESTLDSSFFDKVNKELMLLPFNDVVYDLENKKVIDGRPEHYFTKTTGYNFPSVTQEKLDMILAFISKIFPIKAVRDYALEHIAYCLSGLTRTELFHILIGVGSNGKTVLQELMEVVLGDFYHYTDSSRFNNEMGNARSADPELVQMNGVRMLCSGEPKKGSSFDGETMKKFTSEKITARNLFSNTLVKYKPQFKIFLMANNLPKVDAEYSIRRRFVAIEMIARFFSNQSKVDEANYRFLKDLSIKERMTELRDAFLMLLLERFNPNSKDDHAPEEIQLASKIYMEENNPFGQFLSTSLEKSDIPTMFVSIGKLYAYYDNWCKCQKVTPCGKQLFKTNLIMHYDEKDIQITVKDANHHYNFTVENGSSKYQYKGNATNALVGFTCPKIDLDEYAKCIKVTHN